VVALARSWASPRWDQGFDGLDAVEDWLRGVYNILSGALRCSQVLSGALRCSQVLSGTLRCSPVCSGVLSGIPMIQKRSGRCRVPVPSAFRR